MSWTEEKVEKLKNFGAKVTLLSNRRNNWRVSRNAVIGKAHRLNLSAKIMTRSANNNHNPKSYQENTKVKSGRSKK